MSNNAYIEREVKKVLESSEYPKNMALASAWIIAHFKGVNIKIFDVSSFSSLCDYNIIATAENVTQAKSMAQEIQNQLKVNGANVNSVEGLAEGEWILIDLGDFIIHIFQEISRDIFNLEDLWREAGQVQIPNEFYYGPGENEKKLETSENYF